MNYQLSSNETAVDVDHFCTMKRYSHIEIRPEMERNRKMCAEIFYVTNNSKANPTCMEDLLI
jgi:hypothetical protein